MTEHQTATITIKETSSKVTKDYNPYTKVVEEGKGIIYNIPESVGIVKAGDKITVNYNMVEYKTMIAGIEKLVKSRWVISFGELITPTSNKSATGGPVGATSATGTKSGPSQAQVSINPILYQVALQSIMLLVDTGYIDKTAISEESIIMGIKRIAGELNK